MTDQTWRYGATGPGRYRFGDVFTRSFAVFGRQFPLFLALGCVSAIPIFLHQTQIPFVAAQQSPPTPFGTPASGLLFTATTVFSFLVEILIVTLAVQMMRDGRANFAEALGRTARRLPTLIGMLLVLGLALVVCCVVVAVPIGIFSAVLKLGPSSASPGPNIAVLIIIGVLLGIPFIIGFVMLAVMIPACLNEDLGPIATLRRSAWLTKGSRWLIFASYILLMLVNGAVSFGWARISVAIGGATFAVYMIAPVTALLQTYGSIFSGSLYHELRQAKEGRGTDRLAEVFT